MISIIHSILLKVPLLHRTRALDDNSSSGSMPSFFKRKHDPISQSSQQTCSNNSWLTKNMSILQNFWCLWVGNGCDVTMFIDRVYSCGTCKVVSGQLHVYIAVRTPWLLGQPEERETRRRANADAMREARTRESREEGDTRRRANADAMREARAREVEETRRRASSI